MTKIKNFRITLRPREVARILKNEYHLPLTPELESTIETLVVEAKTFVKPAALYTTLTRATAEKATSLALPKSAIAVSVIAVSVGAQLEDLIQAAAEKGDESRSTLLLALRQEALGQAIQFSMKLIGQQAKDEECEMSEPWPVHGPPLLASLEALLGVQRIGITVASEEHSELPSSARLVWTSWSPLAKRSSKRDASTPKEKVAA